MSGERYFREIQSIKGRVIRVSKLIKEDFVKRYIYINLGLKDLQELVKLIGKESIFWS